MIILFNCARCELVLRLEFENISTGFSTQSLLMIGTTHVIGYISSLAVYNIAQDGELCVPLELAAGCQTKPVAGLPLYGHCRPSVYLLKHRWGGVNRSFRYPEVLWGVNLVEILIQEWMF